MAKTEPKVEIGSAFDLLPKSWEIVKKNWKTFAFVNIFTLLSSLTAFGGDEYTEKSDWVGGSGFELGALLGVGIVIGAVLVAVNVLLYVMMTVLEIRTSAGRSPSISELFEAATKNWLWLRLIGLTIAAGLIVVVGLLLLIVPGLIAIGRVIMSGYFMVDKDMSITESLKASNEMGKKHPGKVWAAIGVMILVAIASSILGAIDVIGPLLGALLTIAFSVVLALRYQQLKALS